MPKKKTAMSAAAARGEPPDRPPGDRGYRTKPRGPKGPSKGPNNSEKKPDGAFQKVKNWWADVLKQAKKK